MSQNIGTLITAAIRPNDSLDLIASAYASEIKGGHHSVQSHSDMNAIYDVRRVEGMQCYVIDEGLTYILSGGTTNANWTLSTVDWSQISNIPTTLSGYGITDAWTTGETITYLNNNYYTTAQTYTQTEIDNILNGYETIVHAQGTYQTIIGMSEYYTSAQTDALLTNYYTSGETDTLLTNYSLTSHTHTLSGLTDVDLNNYSVLASGDTLIYKNGNWVNSAVTISVDMSNYYTITQVDTIIDNLSGFTGLTNLHEMNDVDSGITAALNGQALGWDSSLGLWTNIDVAIDLSAYYTSSQTDALFYNSAQTNALFSSTAHTHALSGLSDVDSGATDGQYLQYSAGTWSPATSSAIDGAYVHLTGDTMSGNLVFDFMSGTTDRNLYVDNNGTVSEGDEIIELYLSGSSLINYITSGDTTSGGTIVLWSGSTFVNTGLSAYTLYEGQKYIDQDYFYEFFDGNLHRTWYAKKEHDHDDRYYTINQLSGGCLDWRYSSSNTLAGLLDTTINIASLTDEQILIYTGGTWVNSSVTFGTTDDWLDNDLTSNQDVGGVEIGDFFPSGTTFEEMFIEILAPELPPTLTNNSALLAGYTPIHVEVGTYLSFTLTSSYNQGLIHSQDSHPNIDYTGDVSATTYSGDGNVNSSTGIVTHTATTSQSWQVDIDYYATGGSYYTSRGNESHIFDTEHLNTGSSIATGTITGYYNLWYASSGASLTGGSAVRAFNHLEDIAHFTYIIPSGNSYTAFYIKGGVQDINVKYVQSSNAQMCSSFSTTSVNIPDANGVDVAYTKYEQYIGGTGYSADATYDVIIGVSGC